jgi:hypothetical protein
MAKVVLPRPDKEMVIAVQTAKGTAIPIKVVVAMVATDKVHLPKATVIMVMARQLEAVRLRVALADKERPQDRFNHETPHSPITSRFHAH